MMMFFGLFKVATVWLPVCAVCLRLLPLYGPGRVPFCLGLSGIASMLVTGMVMWASLVWTGQINHWWPSIIIGSAALLVWWRTLPSVTTPTRASMTPPAGRLSQAITVILLALIGVRFATLLPDVALRPLLGWDAAVVWAYEARVWFEAGRYVEFLPPQDWMAPASEGWVRLTATEYPRTIPALILWFSMVDATWSGVGPGLVWWLGAVCTTALLFGALRAVGLSMPWALAGAYVWSSLPMVAAHVALYGYADLWLAYAFASFVACSLLASAHRHWIWWALAVLSLAVMPLIKVEGLYWLAVGLVSIALGRWGIGMRGLVVCASIAAFGVWLAATMGWDVFHSMSQGRLSLSPEDWNDALRNGVNHAFVWYDWHLLFYAAFALIAIATVFPTLMQPHLSLAATAVLGLLIVWALLPITQASVWFTQSTLFSRIALHVSPVLSLFVVIALHRLFETRDARVD